MKKNINLDDFENIMLGQKKESKIKHDSKPVQKVKKNVVNTTFEEPDVSMEELLGIKNNPNKTKSVKVKKKVVNTTFEESNVDMKELLGVKDKSTITKVQKVKKNVVNTTFEEPIEILDKKSFKENQNITWDYFIKHMLGVSNTKKLEEKKVVAVPKQNKIKKVIKKEVPVIKTIIIDGSNVLRKMYKMKEEKELNYDTETRLVVLFYEFLKQYVIGSYQKISLFLDGEKRKINTKFHPHIQLEFSKRKKADELIVNDLYQTIQQQPNIKKEIKLITEDRELINRCKEICADIEIVASNKLLELFGHSKDFVLNKNKEG